MKTVVSKKYTFIKKDIKSLAIGLGITLLGAALTYFTEFVANTDFGTYSPLVVTGFALIVNAIRKYVDEGKYIK